MTRERQSIFPDIPRESPVVDNKGDFTQLWSLGFGALFQALQENYKNEGIIIPPLSNNNMNTIQSLYAKYIAMPYNTLTSNLPDISGQTVFDKDTYITNQFVIAVDTNNIVTLAQWVPLAVMIANNGNPNGTQAGVLNWLCYDFSGKMLYACTTAGYANAGIGTPAAVWTAV